jgi:hypothetical protein
LDADIAVTKPSARLCKADIQKVSVKRVWLGGAVR